MLEFDRVLMEHATSVTSHKSPFPIFHYNLCKTVFSSPDDLRYFTLRRNVWE